ncbi:MAG: polyprenyl synthetase family protein [Pseudomonadales bacterium]|nr:polyprenyl synthetase family protein [Pseudomonadales bacterium]
MANHLYHSVADDYSVLNQKVVAHLHSEISLIESIGHYIIEAGGKRMRPLLVLLCARACGYQGTQHIDLATVIEFLHTATLLHDDVVDMSKMRRGKPTVNTRWDNPSSVLVGDFIYSRAFQLLVSLGNIDIMEVMANTTNRISEGEVLQLVNQHNPETTEASYMKVVRNKTAILFAAACKTAAILANADSRVQNCLNEYGLDVGLAFQLIDDVLDYNGSSVELGKNIGDDLSEGKPTLPLIYAMQNGSQTQKQLISEAIQHGGLDNLDTIITAVRESGALDYTRELAQTRINNALKCLDVLPPSVFRQALTEVADAALNRSS